MQRTALLSDLNASVAGSESIPDFVREIRPPLAENGFSSHVDFKRERDLNLIGIGASSTNLHGEISTRIGLQPSSFANSSDPLKGL